MIKTTPTEVYSYLNLKEFTEKSLSEELYEAIVKDDDFMKYARATSKTALEKLEEILKSLELLGLAGKIDELLKKASPLQLWYQLGREEGEKAGPKARDKEYKKIEDKRKELIGKYDKKILDLEKQEAERFSKFNKDVAAAKDDSEKSNLKKAYYEDKKKSYQEILTQRALIDWQHDWADNLVSAATTDFTGHIKRGDVDTLIKRSDSLKPEDCSDVFRLFGTVVEELPDFLKENNKSLEDLGKDKAEELTLWLGLRQSYRETTGLDWKDLVGDEAVVPKGKPIEDKYVIDREEMFVKYCATCGEYFAPRGHGGAAAVLPDNTKPNKGKNDDVKTEGRDDYICSTCNNATSVQWKKCSPKEDKIGKCGVKGCGGELVLKKQKVTFSCPKGHLLSDKIMQTLVCTNEACPKHDEPQNLLLDPNDRVMEKPGWCPECKPKNPKGRKILTLQPAAGFIRPFWKDLFRARSRAGWSVGFVLAVNSVVRTIDRMFGLPQGADISGTTADTLFGLELTANLMHYGEKVVGTQRGGVELGEERDLSDNAWLRKTEGFGGSLALLPLITMSKLKHHTILECALTLALTGYIDAYHIGYYTTLWPKGTPQSGKLWDILKKWENSPTNAPCIIDYASDGSVKGGWAFSPDEVKDRADESFYDLTRLNYQRYVDVFSVLRNIQNENKQVGHLHLLKEVLQSNIRSLQKQVAFMKEEHLRKQLQHRDIGVSE